MSRREIAALAESLPVPCPWNLDVFLARISDIRNRPIRRVAVDTSGLVNSPCGLWIDRDTEDLIVHERDTSDYHIDQIVCHEIGHMMLDHHLNQQSDLGEDRVSDIHTELLPDLDPRVVKSILTRSQFDSDQEREAETFANILMIRAAEAGARQSMIRSMFFPQR
ncbi:hypothetical protein H7J07_05820 [Mycobacterium koreense]|nr:hypothetical protein [Mycolicibacillus koreensis]MCV7247743.1 hypothetical protein [Mycolicibacillus koreensis]BBY54127.1 hypothetical protein MKOR_13780 [Mycolicibacillus koreensis]